MALPNQIDFTNSSIFGGGGIFTLTVPKAKSSLVDNNSRHFIYEDLGDGFFANDFIIQGTLFFNSTSIFQLLYFNTLANDLSDANGNLVGGKNQIGIFLTDNGGAPQIRISESNGGARFNSASIFLNLSTLHYYELRVVESDSVFGTVYLDVYTDSGRTILLDSASLELKSLASYKYFMGQQNNDSGAGGTWGTDVFIENVSYTTPGPPPEPPIPPTAPETPNFFRIFKHLLPRAKAWRLSSTKQLTQFFQGLTGIGDDVKEFFDLVWLDIFPDTTRELERWETQFGLPETSLTEQERRDRLTSSWQALGGQDPTYIQDTLQAAGFPVYLHEWWETPVGNPPVARNPLTYLNDGLTPTQYIANCGAQKANCGGVEAICGASIAPTGFALVNKFFVALFGTTCGAQAANCGNSEAVCGARTSEYELKKYKIPTDPDTWPYFLYIGGQTFPNHATIPASRRNEFETLCLKLCPTQQWLGMLIDYA